MSFSKPPKVDNHFTESLLAAKTCIKGSNVSRTNIDNGMYICILLTNTTAIFFCRFLQWKFCRQVTNFSVENHLAKSLKKKAKKAFEKLLDKQMLEKLKDDIAVRCL